MNAAKACPACNGTGVTDDSTRTDDAIGIGDRVKVKEQDIRGLVVRFDCGRLVVLDDARNEWADDGEEGVLVFSASEVEREWSSRQATDLALYMAFEAYRALAIAGHLSGDEEDRNLDAKCVGILVSEIIEDSGHSCRTALDQYRILYNNTESAMEALAGSDTDELLTDPFLELALAQTGSMIRRHLGL